LCPSVPSTPLPRRRSVDPSVRRLFPSWPRVPFPHEYVRPVSGSRIHCYCVRCDTVPVYTTRIGPQTAGASLLVDFHVRAHARAHVALYKLGASRRRRRVADRRTGSGDTDRFHTSENRADRSFVSTTRNDVVNRLFRAACPSANATWSGLVRRGVRSETWYNRTATTVRGGKDVGKPSGDKRTRRLSLRVVCHAPAVRERRFS